MSRRKLKSRSDIPTACCDVEQPKDLKKRIKDVKHDLSILVDVVDRGMISYEVGNQAVGSLYIELTRLKDRLKRAKQHG